MKRTRTFKTGPLWLLGALYLLLQLSMAQAMPTPTPPALPMQFNGFVTVDGGPVPEGTLIEASVNALPCRNATTFAFENQSAYVLSVDCGADGDRGDDDERRHLRRPRAEVRQPLRERHGSSLTSGRPRSSP